MWFVAPILDSTAQELPMTQQPNRTWEDSELFRGIYGKAFYWLMTNTIKMDGEVEAEIVFQQNCWIRFNAS